MMEQAELMTCIYDGCHISIGLTAYGYCNMHDNRLKERLATVMFSYMVNDPDGIGQDKHWTYIFRRGKPVRVTVHGVAPGSVPNLTKYIAEHVAEFPVEAGATEKHAGSIYFKLEPAVVRDGMPGLMYIDHAGALIVKGERFADFLGGMTAGFLPRTKHNVIVRDTRVEGIIQYNGKGEVFTNGYRLDPRTSYLVHNFDNRPLEQYGAFEWGTKGPKAYQLAVALVLSVGMSASQSVKLAKYLTDLLIQHLPYGRDWILEGHEISDELNRAYIASMRPEREHEINIKPSQPSWQPKTPRWGDEIRWKKLADQIKKEGPYYLGKRQT